MEANIWNPPEPQYMKEQREMKAKMGMAQDPITENIFRKDLNNAKSKSKTNKRRKS